MHSFHPSKFRRHVIYISGFDPRGANFLHKNCAQEARKWSTITGNDISVSPRQRCKAAMAHHWNMSARFSEVAVETTFSFLRWDDIIRAHWSKGEVTTALRTFALLIHYIVSGVFGKAVRDSWPFAVTMTAAAGWVVISLFALLFLCISALLFVVLPAWAAWVSALACVGLVLWSLCWGFHNIERTKPGWTGRIGLFSSMFVLRQVPGLDDRLDLFVDYVIETMDQETNDEVLIVGHSFGTALASLVTARVLVKRPDFGVAGGKLALITLGQIQSLAAHSPEADWFREELAGLAKFADFTWLDFSSPLDGACYALVNVLDFLPEPKPQNIPRLLNAQFHKLFLAETIEHSRRHPMEMHFLYLKASELPQLDTDLYDFFMLISGPVTAARRYRSRKSGSPFFRKATER
jgi:pimeloyl-ACP methyl ester carboxylesterase